MQTSLLVPPRVGQELAQDPPHEVGRQAQRLAFPAPALEDLPLAIGIVKRRLAVLALEAGDLPDRLHAPRQKREQLAVDLVDRGSRAAQTFHFHLLRQKKAPPNRRGFRVRCLSTIRPQPRRSDSSP